MEFEQNLKWTSEPLPTTQTRIADAIERIAELLEVIAKKDYLVNQKAGKPE